MQTKHKRCLSAIAAAVVILTTVCLNVSDALAQSSWGIINYEISFPSGPDTADFVDETSFRGIGFEGRWFQNQRQSLGYSVDWNVLHESTSDAFSLGNTTVSGKQERTINTFPMLVTGHYYMGPDKMFFTGLGAGLYFMEQRFDIGVYSFTDSSWHLGLAPEVGFSYPLTYDVRALLSLRYNYGFQASDTTLSYWTLKVGFAF